MSSPATITPTINKRRGWIRNLLLIFIILILLVALWIIYQRFIVFPMADFLEYWASGRINISGGNPYNPSQLLSLERTLGWVETQPLMMLNPPWTLFYAMLFGFFNYTFSRFLCFIVQIFVVFLCSILVWNVYDGDKRREWIGWLAILSFGPILRAIQSGQVTILVLLGTVGFLYFITKKYDFWAGVMASLVLIKPHLLFLFILALILWSLYHRRYLVLIGLISALVIPLIVVWTFNSQIFYQYIDMIRFYPLENWMTSTLGDMLRSVIDPERFYLQFIPAFIGIVWFVIFWLRNKRQFDWKTHLPLIIIVSSIVSPYGWTLDFSMIVIGLIQIAVLFEFRHWSYQKLLIFISYWFVNLLIILLSVRQNWFWWYPSFILIWYLLSNRYLIIISQTSSQKEMAVTP